MLPLNQKSAQCPHKFVWQTTGYFEKLKERNFEKDEDSLTSFMYSLYCGGS
uniref:Uncharacterized protein n=1 Tax=Anguilla anguilla TaxID=7936 RepID=A0A0E9VVS0_ANGAN